MNRLLAMTHADREAIASTPTNVLVLIPTLHAGGAEMDLVRNLPRIDCSKFKIAVIAFLAEGNLAASLRDAGIEVVGPITGGGWLWKTWHLGKRTARWMPKFLVHGVRRVAHYLMLLPFGSLSYLGFARQIAIHIRERRIDVVHAVLPNSYLLGALACCLAQRPALVMSRVSLNWYQDWFFSAIERKFLHRMVDLAICNSSAIQQELLAEGLPPGKIRLIRNGIDSGEFRGVERKLARDQLGVSQDAFVLTVVANFHPYKGHADLLQALQIARNRFPLRWILLAVGRDIDANLQRMLKLTDQLGLTANVRFLGERADIPVILRASDIHISASHTEGFPNNVLEAMCAGLPVVATAVGGVPEMVVNGQTGLLVPARNADEMARALLQLAGDPAQRRSMGEAGRDRVATLFSIEQSAQALQKSYAELGSRRQS
jgi:glycosyltransferase involved in cell wall biosynthesis